MRRSPCFISLPLLHQLHPLPHLPILLGQNTIHVIKTHEQESEESLKEQKSGSGTDNPIFIQIKKHFKFSMCLVCF